jgi:hypothetical protein
MAGCIKETNLFLFPSLATENFFFQVDVVDI